jgi:hypothetical protein
MSGIASSEQLESREMFADLLAQTFEPTEIVQLLSEIGLRLDDLALALNVHPRTIRAWIDDSDPRQADRQRDEIQALKAVVLFMLRRGILKPQELAYWLVEPNAKLDFRRPLAVLGDGDISETMSELIKAGAPFLKAEPERPSNPQRGAAVGAVTHDRPIHDALEGDEPVGGAEEAEAVVEAERDRQESPAAGSPRGA